MNSFISNFKSESRVLLIVFLVMLVSEIAVRTLRPELSADIVHIKTIPQIAQAMSAKKGLGILFLGNSLTRQGVDLHVIRRSISSRRIGPIILEKVYPDDTAILDWYYLFRKYFGGSSAPNYLVLGWVENQLSDESVVHPDRIAAYYGSWRTAGEMLTFDLHETGPQIDFLLSTVLASFAEKERIRGRLLDRLIPDYRSTAQRFNETVLNATKQSGHVYSYSRLRRLLALCRQRHVMLLTVAMPTDYSYAIDPSLLPLLAKNGAVSLDLRTIPGLTGSGFLDGLHLAPSGAVLYSSALAHDIASIVCVARPHPSFAVACSKQ